MNEEQKLIEEQFKKLPPEVQGALNAVPWKSLVKEIALLNKLSPEQTENVERETMFILYGFENPADYIENMIRELPVDEETATTIAEQVNEKILEAITAKLEEKKDEPIVITQENKEDALKELSRRQPEQKPTLPEIAPEIHPMIEPGEVAHEIPHDPKFDKLNKLNKEEETKPQKPPSGTKYPPGQDPYREPIS